MNIDLGKTKISDAVRVSSAAIYYEEWFGDFYQLETFIFSDDPKIKGRQIIHKTVSDVGGVDKKEIKKVHNYIAQNIKQYLDEVKE